MTKSKTEKPTLSVDEAKGILDKLQERKRQNVSARVQIALKRDMLAYSGLTGSSDAAEQLQELRSQLRDYEQEGTDIESAIKVARRQLEEATTRERAEKAAANAAKVRGLAKVMEARAEKIDAALATIADEMAELRKERSQVLAAGGKFREWEIIVKQLEFLFKNAQVKFRHVALIDRRATWTMPPSLAEGIKQWFGGSLRALDAAATDAAVTPATPAPPPGRAKSGLQWEDVHV